jgi:hypothetical protein
VTDQADRPATCPERVDHVDDVIEGLVVQAAEALVDEEAPELTSTSLCEYDVAEPECEAERDLVSAIEVGDKPPKPDFLRAVDEALKTGGLLLRLWEDLVKANESSRSLHPGRRAQDAGSAAVAA